LPFCLPLQSAGQDRQSSPFATSHTPFPQAAPALDAQSLAQYPQSSPASQMPSPSQIGQAMHDARS
jgi:hypothetical protein